MLSTIMELVPFDSLTVKTTPELVLDIMQPTAATQFEVMPQKKKVRPGCADIGVEEFGNG